MFGGIWEGLVFGLTLKAIKNSLFLLLELKMVYFS